MTGFVTEKNDELLTPLIYSTELARSITLGRIHQMDESNPPAPPKQHTGADLKRFKAKYKYTFAGDRNPKSGESAIGSRGIAAVTTYGLINIRTDGQTIMFAARNEKESSWNVNSIKGRF